jgi:hypothetical protein
MTEEYWGYGPSLSLVRKSKLPEISLPKFEAHHLAATFPF